MIHVITPKQWNSARALAARALAFAGPLIVSVLTARALGAQGRGIIAVATNLASTAAGIAILGAQQGLLRALPTYDDPRRLLQSAQVAVGALGLVATLILVTPPVQSLLRFDAPPWAVIIAAMALAPMMVTLVSTDGLVGLGRLRDRDSIVALAAVAPSAAISVLYLIQKLTVTMALLSWAVGHIISAQLATILVHRLRPTTDGRVVDWRAARWVIGLGVRLQPASLSVDLLLRIDVLLIGWLVGAESAGVYAVSLAFSQVHLGLSAAINDAHTPLALKMNAHRSAFLQAMRSSSLTSIALAAAVAATTPVIPHIFGTEFAGARFPALLLLVATTALAAGRPALVRNVAHGNAGKITGVAAVALCANVLLNLLLIPRLGLMGAALSSVLGYVFLAVTHAAMAAQGLVTQPP